MNDFTTLKVIGKGSYGKVLLVKKNDDNKIDAMTDLKMKNDAVNMLLYFKKKLRLIVDMNELRNLVGEFNNEKSKYF